MYRDINEAYSMVIVFQELDTQGRSKVGCKVGNKVVYRDSIIEAYSMVIVFQEAVKQGHHRPISPIHSCTQPPPPTTHAHTPPKCPVMSLDEVKCEVKCA